MRELDGRMRDLAKRRRTELMDFKEDIHVWIDKDHEVTKEWEPQD